LLAVLIWMFHSFMQPFSPTLLEAWKLIFCFLHVLTDGA